MRSPQLFIDISTAPRDGSLVEVRHGLGQEIVKARWAAQNQAFIGDDDPYRKTLHRVTSWRPVMEELQTEPAISLVVPEAAMPAKIDPARKTAAIVKARTPRPRRR